MTKVLYVTGFLDIKRETWDKWEKRGVSNYLEYFYQYIDLFKNNEDFEMIVYMDSAYVDELREKIGKNCSIYVFPIDEDFLTNYSPLWRRLEREKDIMNSEDYRNIVKHRLDYPEHSQPKYTMINNAKIDLIVHAMSISKADVMGWVDFGYIKLPDIKPKRLVDIDKFNLDKMNFSLINHITEEDYDIMKTLTNPREIIEGGFFFSSRNVLREYQKLFHDTHQMFHDMSIVDDDQHIILQCYRKKPEMFEMHFQGKWLESMKYFQLSPDKPKTLL